MEKKTDFETQMMTEIEKRVDYYEAQTEDETERFSVSNYVMAGVVAAFGLFLTILGACI